MMSCLRFFGWRKILVSVSKGRSRHLAFYSQELPSMAETFSHGWSAFMLYCPLREVQIKTSIIIYFYLTFQPCYKIFRGQGLSRILERLTKISHKTTKSHGSINDKWKSLVCH